MKTFKKIILVLAALCMLIGYAPMSFAADELSSGDWKYVLENGGAKVTGYTGTKTKVAVPDKIDGKGVWAIASSAFSGTGIAELTIPASVKEMTARDSWGSPTISALNGMNRLETLIFADKMTKVPDAAAMGNESVTKVVIPASVTEIGALAFEGCSVLKTVSMPNVVTIGANAFNGCGSLEKIEISDKASQETIDQIKDSINAMTGVDVKIEKVVIEEPDQTLYGDLNGDGKVLADDARLALRASARLESLTEDQKKAADVNGDGEVLADDARLILRYSAKLEKEFPVQAA